MNVAAGTKLSRFFHPFAKVSLRQHHHPLQVCCYCRATASTMESRSMGLANALWNQHKLQAMMALYHPFVVSLAAGVLDIGSFRHYIVQDAYFLQAFSTAYTLVLDKIDDEVSKLAVKQLLQAAMKELRLHSSYAKAWGVDTSTASQPNKATLKYTEFLLATARGEESTRRETTTSNRQKLAALTVGAMTPCMRLYAFLGQEIVKYIDEDYSDVPYHEWIDTYSSKDFQSSTLQIEHLLDTLATHLGEDDVSKLERLYSQAFTLELDFFSAQPNCQCAMLPFIRRQIDGSDAIYLLMMDFDLTCSVTDSCLALANISKQVATGRVQGDSQTADQISSLDIRRRWDYLEKSYSENYKTFSIPPNCQEHCDRYFDADGLRSFLEKLSEFEIQSNSEIVKQGLFEGLRLGEVWRAGHNVAFQEGCTEFLRQISLHTNVNAHIISVCWSKSFIEGALSKEGLDYLQVHSNEFISSGQCTSEDIKRVVETPFDKKCIMEELMNNAEGLSRAVRSIYIGDSLTDLLCLLKADLGIVVGSNSTLQRVTKAFGVSLVPLYKGVLNMAKLGSFQGAKRPGVLYAVRDWHEIQAFLIASSNCSTKIAS